MYLCKVKYKTSVKPFFDYFCAAIALLIFMPIILVLGVVLVIVNRGTPFYFQTRTGKEDRLFRICKFKTMTDRKDHNGQLLPDASRLTRFGILLRKTSLDEIPQLWNVLKGDMSLIGPRPLLPSYLKLYSKEQRRRGNVKPGITGWAQVNGRNAISWTRKLELDTWYLENQSFWLDMKILQKTVKIVILKEDINTEGQATTAPFAGTN
jgi:lipopolysaccharide/colanic/teichoic acid biosynthesis glycosyltransferase